jgi:DNA-binding NarL/FixJ family response regulator
MVHSAHEILSSVPSFASHLAHSDAKETKLRPVADLWRDLGTGSLVITEAFCGVQRCYAVVRRVNAGRNRPRAEHWELLRQLLVGEPQKCVAASIDRSTSSVTGAVGTCLRAIGLECKTRHAPTALIVAAYGYSFDATMMATWTTFESGTYCVVSMPRPDPEHVAVMTAAEREVARGMVEGKTSFEIATHRSAAFRTVANQISGLYHKLGAGNRCHLVCRLLATRALPGDEGGRRTSQRR